MTAIPVAAREPQSSVQEMSDETFRTITKIAKKKAGLMISDRKRTLVHSRISRRLRALGLHGFDDYVALVSSQSGSAELSHMISALTTNVSSFFRENHHFQQLRDTILPLKLKEARSGGRLRIWSAGCSSGQEPYSIAMEILALEPKAHQFDVKILATDIDQNILATAKSGLFDQDDMKHVPESYRGRFFGRPQDPEHPYEVQKELRDLVFFRSLNLLNDWPMRGPFDVIFCRNVVIYFDENTQRQLWTRFRKSLARGGSLFVGHSERIATPGEFGFCADGVTGYRAI